MPKITVDGIEFNSEDLSEAGKAQLASLEFLVHQMNKIKSEIAVYKTAQSAYAAALKEALASEKDQESKEIVVKLLCIYLSVKF